MFEWLRKTDLLESHQLHRQWFPWVHHIDSRAYMSMVLPMISYGLPPPPLILMCACFVISGLYFESRRLLLHAIFGATMVCLLLFIYLEFPLLAGALLLLICAICTFFFIHLQYCLVLLVT